MRLLLLSFFLLCGFSSSAQVVLQMEKYGTPKTKKFYQGQKITYLLNGQKEWFDGTIDQLITDRKLIVFDQRYTKLEDVAGIRTYQNRAWSRAAAGGLYTFGLSWTGFSLVSALVKSDNPLTDDPYTWGDVGVAGVSFGLGFLVQKLFRHNTYKFGKKRNLRIVDLTVVPF